MTITALRDLANVKTCAPLALPYYFFKEKMEFLALPYYFFKEKMEFLGQSPSLERRKAMRYGDGYGRYVTD